MYTLKRKRTGSQSKQDSRPNEVANLQKHSALAEVNPEKFWNEHSAISRNQPEKVTSLGKTGEPVSIHWQDGPEAKVLIRNLDLSSADVVSRAAETVLDHITRFYQHPPFPKEIYLDTDNWRKNTGKISDFSGKLVEGVNKVNKTNYDYEIENIGERYIKLKIHKIRLQQMFEARNVIVVGEAHGDLETAEMEKNLLPILNPKIDVSLEKWTIDAPGGKVTPDPRAYRLLYYLEDFYAQLLARRNNHNNHGYRQSYYNLMNDTYNRYVEEFNNSDKTDIEGSLDYKGRPLTTYDRLEELRTTLFKTLELIEDRPNDAGVYSSKLILDNALSLQSLFDNLKKASGNSRDEPVMRKLRSTRMYQALQADLAGIEKMVYKVGNNHVNDIRAQFGYSAWVIDEGQYKRRLLTSIAENKEATVF